MLSSSIGVVNQSDSQSYRHLGAKSFLTACFCIVVVIVIGGTVAISLIPIYVNHHRSGTCTQCTSDNQIVIFAIVPNGTITIADGPINSAGLAQLQTILQARLSSNQNKIISTSQIVVLSATVATATTAGKKKREILELNAAEIDNSAIQNDEKSLTVTYKIIFLNTYDKSIQAIHLKVLQADFYFIIIPLSIFFTPCQDTIDYQERITGYTCQTYVDYGFCNGSALVPSAPIDTALAEANCCSCGKQPYTKEVATLSKFASLK